MRKTTTTKTKTELRTASSGDWRAATIARVRASIDAAAIAEKCGYKNGAKLTLANGAQREDPSRLFAFTALICEAVAVNRRV
jgi:hypothetical protein